MKKTLFIKNAVILTATSLILRIFGIVFKIWIASKIGSEGVGLYHLIFSVYVLANAFATTGLPTASTRMITEALTKNDTCAVIKIMKRGAVITAVFSIISFITVFLLSDFISLKILGDIRILPSLKILCFSLPFMGFSSIIKSYFFARRNVTVNSISVLIEQTVRIIMCLVFVKYFAKDNTTAAITAVVSADTISEIISFLFLFIKFSSEKRKYLLITSSTASYGETKKLLKISTPLLISRYSTSLLRTVENVLVPKTLSKSLSYSTAVSFFGAIKGMALPVLFFPSSILNSLSSLLLPEISEAVAKNRRFVIRSAVRKTLKTTWLLGVIFSSIFFFCGEIAGNLIYHDIFSGHLIKILSPIVPLMYLDSISDGILKGLDQQTYTFFTSFFDSSIRIFLIILFVPEFSDTGFLAIMVFSNIFTCFLHTNRLFKLTGLKPKVFKDIVFPVILAFSICFFSEFIFSFLKNDIVFLAVFSLFSCVVFVLSITAFKIIDIHDYI